MTHQSHSGGIDPGEPGPIGERVNSEVGRLDDVGFVDEGDDAKLNIDFKDNARVILKIPGGGFTGDVPLDVEKVIDVLPARRGVHGSTL